jgi:outer membrane immunogenic protein
LVLNFNFGGLPMNIHRIALTTLAAAGVSVSVGQIASAADMPIKAARAPVAVTYNWTGFYVGANAGYGWGRSSWIDDPIFGAADLGTHTIKGGIIGGQVGYNWQSAAWVLGLEADIDWANLKGNHVDQFLSDLNTKATAVGTLTGRVGYAWSQDLLYLKGGAGWARFKYDDFVTLGGALNGSSSSTRWGWMIGGGLEHAFAANWSAKIEYNYLDFGTKRLTFGGGAGGTFVQDITDRVHLFKVGVNYRFGR